MLITFIFILSFVIRVLPRYYLKELLLSDTYYHLFVARKIRSNNFKHIKTIEEFVIPNIQRYPYFFHFVLALFPFNLRMKFERISGAFFDSIYLLIFYKLATYVQKEFSYCDFEYFPEIVCLLFTFSPALLRTGDGPRAYNCNPRVFALLIYLLHIFSFFLYTHTQKIEYALSSIFFGGLIFITAIFAIQVTLFFSFFFVLFYSWWYFVFVAISFLFSILISGGWSIEIIRGSVRHLRNYYLIQERVLEWYNSTLSSYLINAKNKIINLIKVRDFKTFFNWWYIRDNFWLHLLITVFPAFLIFPLSYSYVGISRIDKFLFVFSTAGFIYFLLTKYRKLQFLGSGERYLEYAFLPATFIFVKYTYNNNLLLCVYLLLVYSVSLTPYYIYTYIGDNRTWDSYQKEFREIFAYTQEHLKGVYMPLNTDDRDRKSVV